MTSYIKYLFFVLIFFASNVFANKALADLVVSHSCYGVSLKEDGRVIAGTSFKYPGRLCSKCCGRRRTTAKWYDHTIRGRNVSCVIISNIGKLDDISEAYAVYWDNWANEWVALPGNPYRDCHKSTLDPNK